MTNLFLEEDPKLDTSKLPPLVDTNTANQIVRDYFSCKIDRAINGYLYRDIGHAHFGIFPIGCQKMNARGMYSPAEVIGYIKALLANSSDKIFD